MSVDWTTWEKEFLERERAFERRPVRQEDLAPWGLWDWSIALFVICVLCGFFVLAARA